MTEERRNKTLRALELEGAVRRALAARVSRAVTREGLLI